MNMQELRRTYFDPSKLQNLSFLYLQSFWLWHFDRASSLLSSTSHSHSDFRCFIASNWRSTTASVLQLHCPGFIALSVQVDKGSGKGCYCSRAENAQHSQVLSENLVVWVVFLGSEVQENQEQCKLLRNVFVSYTEKKKRKSIFWVFQCVAVWNVLVLQHFWSSRLPCPTFSQLTFFPWIFMMCFHCW